MAILKYNRDRLEMFEKPWCKLTSVCWPALQICCFRSCNRQYNTNQWGLTPCSSRLCESIYHLPIIEYGTWRICWGFVCICGHHPISPAASMFCCCAAHVHTLNNRTQGNKWCKSYIYTTWAFCFFKYLGTLKLHILIKHWTIGWLVFFFSNLHVDQIWNLREESY